MLLLEKPKAFRQFLIAPLESKLKLEYIEPKKMSLIVSVFQKLMTPKEVLN